MWVSFGFSPFDIWIRLIIHLHVLLLGFISWKTLFVRIVLVSPTKCQKQLPLHGCIAGIYTSTFLKKYASAANINVSCCACLSYQLVLNKISRVWLFWQHNLVYIMYLHTCLFVIIGNLSKFIWIFFPNTLYIAISTHTYWALSPVFFNFLPLKHDWIIKVQHCSI